MCVHVWVCQCVIIDYQETILLEFSFALLRSLGFQPYPCLFKVSGHLICSSLSDALTNYLIYSDGLHCICSFRNLEKKWGHFLFFNSWDSCVLSYIIWAEQKDSGMPEARRMKIFLHYGVTVGPRNPLHFRLNLGPTWLLVGKNRQIRSIENWPPMVVLYCVCKLFGLPLIKSWRPSLWCWARLCECFER